MGRYVSVPLMRYSDRRDDILSQLDNLGADRVFLCTERGFCSDEQRKAQLDTICDGISFFKEKGFSVGIWLSSLGHGGSLSGVKDAQNYEGFTNIVGATGESAKDSFCPLDENFADKYLSWIALLASTDADMIMLDDDFRLSNRPGGFGCFCEKHMKLICERLDENISREQLVEKAYRGGKNKYRDAYLDIEGETLRSFAKRLRNAVDKVNPDMRLGACACISTWDGDGIDSIEISRILAGKTKPFMRFIGAAYWAAGAHGMGVFANKLGYIIEIERMQAHWCNGLGIETMTEGDVYPRPRYNVPSAFLEGFDTALLADGKADGILKYAIDYTSSPTYETGYSIRAARNKPLYEYISKHFSAKTAEGIKVSCQMKKLRDGDYSDKAVQITQIPDYSFFQPEQAFLCDNSLPACYGESDVCVCFGENAKYVDINSFAGLVLDIPAALILKEKSIYTGIVSATELTSAANEYFPVEDEVTCLSSSGGLFQAQLSPGARALSFFDEGSSLPSAYTYKNSDGMRFYVLCADMNLARQNMGFRRSYSRQRQAIDAVRFLSPSAIPAVCPGSPELYIMCKADENSLSVGMWNFFADSVINPKIMLSKEYKTVEFYNCGGELLGDTVELDGEIPAFGCVFFTVSK